MFRPVQIFSLILSAGIALAAPAAAGQKQEKPAIAYTEKALEATKARLEGPAPEAPDVRAVPYYIVRNPYDETMDARAAVDAALVRAKAENKLVALKLGANWCGDCLILSGMMKIPAFADYLDQKFIVLNIDVGKFDKNIDIPRDYGLEQLTGIPALMFLDADGSWLNSDDDPGQWATSRDRNAQDAMDYFWKYGEEFAD